MEIEWNPAINQNNVLRDYVIYVQQPDNSISKHSTTNNNILLSNIFFDLILNQNIFVTAHSEPSRDNRVILLPIIGILQTMRKGNIIRLYSIITLNMLFLFSNPFS